MLLSAYLFYFTFHSLYEVCTNSSLYVLKTGNKLYIWIINWLITFMVSCCIFFFLQTGVLSEWASLQGK